ncbi:ABC transporter permease [Massilibacteroides vaginae]|uniref:ABC transporter permease n=1 Tax=Massilibacteroides vaginae TaxID=1673718 RepID=UPI000A1CE3B0|nr:ABC transporter permease [Massilibacteroides vaginae]
MLRLLLEKEFKQIGRDSLMPRLIVLMPVIQLIILPFAANFEMKNVNLAIVDNDRSVVTAQLTDKIISSGYFRLTALESSYENALPFMENNNADIIFEYPLAMEKDLGQEGSVTVSITANAVNGTKAGLGSSYLASIIRQYNLEQTLSTATAPVQIKSTHLFNHHLDYKAYMVPGIMAFLLTLIGGFLSALNIVAEKEKGTIEQINVTPVPKSIFLLSKLVPFWIIGLILLAFGMLTAWVIYGFVPVGNILTIYLFAAIYLIALTGLGLAVSAISTTQQQAMFTMFFCAMIFALLSGLFTPISSMPQWAQTITLFNPIRYFVEVMRMIYLKGSYLTDIADHLLIVCGFAVFFNAIAILGYRKKRG